MRRRLILCLSIWVMLSRLLKPLYTNEFFHLGMVHCTYQGDTGWNFKIKCVSVSQDYVFILANSTDPDEMLHMQHFIWVCTVCQSTHLRVPGMQRDNITLCMLGSFA